MKTVWCKVIDAEFVELEPDEYVQEVNEYKTQLKEKIFTILIDILSAYCELGRSIKFFVKRFFRNAYKKHSTLICFLLWVSVLFAFRIAGSWVVSRIPLDV